jgi:hypothetical protein
MDFNFKYETKSNLPMNILRLEDYEDSADLVKHFNLNKRNIKNHTLL